LDRGQTGAIASDFSCWVVYLQRMRSLPLTLRSAVCGLSLLVLSSCGGKADLVENPKVIAASNERDTIYVERSKFWETNKQKASVDSNRQFFIFKPKASEAMFVLLENTGGVPLSRDTIRQIDTLSLEHFLRTPAKDTNLYMRIEYADYRKAPTDVFLYIRNPDSVYQQVVFVAR
jgi:hypothetical protein